MTIKATRTPESYRKECEAIAEAIDGFNGERILTQFAAEQASQNALSMTFVVLPLPTGPANYQSR